MLGPFYADVEKKQINYRGNKIFLPRENILSPQKIGTDRISVLLNQKEIWEALLVIDHYVNHLIIDFFDKHDAFWVDVPLLTRSISSPGYLTEEHKIITDVRPFKLQYTDSEIEIFLSQSSQFYLEAYLLLLPELARGVYTIGKSFRNEESDFRHLAEFRHAEFEFFGDLEAIISLQEQLILFLLENIISSHYDKLLLFLDEHEIKNMSNWKPPFLRITFYEAMKELYNLTQDKSYLDGDTASFNSFAEIALHQALGENKPIFVLYYPWHDVAFYHAILPKDTSLAINADLLFPGFGEIIGSGERLHTFDDYLLKRDTFDLDPRDYDWYGELRKVSTATHSGFGLGIERFLTFLLKLPHIKHSVAFPRTSSIFRP